MSEAAVGILGAGAFGTALAQVVRAAGRQVILCDDRGGDGPSLAELADGARLIVLAVPSSRVQDVVVKLGEVLDGRHLVVHSSGALVGERARRMSEVLRGETSVKRIGVMAGPALGRDLAEGRPCAVVIASPFDEVVAEARAALGGGAVLRAYGSRDLTGVELAAALSGAMTVALGLADGLGLGAGPRAVLVCRAVAEGSRVVTAAGGKERTFGGLAGLGNLLVRSSASSDRSDDYQLGEKLARGEGGRPTEGARAALGAVRLARKVGVRTPILDAVCAIVHDQVPVKQAAARLVETAAEEE